jgi:hypothetical protein
VRALLAFAIAAVVAITLVAQEHAVKLRANIPAEDDLLLLPTPGSLRVMSLRHTELMADLIFVRALIYFGDQMVHLAHKETAHYRWIENYLDTIVTLDPYFKTVYRWAGTATMYNGTDITNESVEISNRLLARGAERFPDDWELSFMLGANYLYELKTKDPAQRAAWDETGASYVERAAATASGPTWLPTLAATLLTRQGKTELAIRHLQESYLLTQDEKLKTEIRNKLLSLTSKAAIADIEAERAQFDAAWKQHAPYVPSDFFVIMGAPSAPRLDWRYLANLPPN